ncbi:MAG: LysM peptidoglycan-binding domain-containing protein, partial [Paludibacteraceae bacterium]|nr:LysM peptidoglycan-binding domain-containing protein [Paludibacteraceae bacterium]
PDNWSRKRYQVIRSVYDEPIYGESTNNEIYQAFGEGGQQHLRNRIATTLYQEVYDASPTHYSHATHYSYDIHGNVSTLVHDIYGLRNIGQRFKRIDYDYDLVSGKVNRLDYQKDKADGYSLRYEYDAENRLTRVLANYQGDDAWNELARYEYYRHGPLARTVLGTNLQGVDYAYTLQGWTKGVNLSQESDTVKADVYGYELQYNNEDYKPIGIANHPQVDDGAANLYNGNIAAMRTTLTQNVPANEGNLFGAQTRRFVYDELNRLKASQVLGSDQYKTSYTYDANGNITTLTRNDQSGSAMDNLTYHYATDAKGNILNNRLLHVNDAVRNNATTTDIKDQNQNDVSYEQQKPSTHNYDYDEIGNLIKDKSEEIAEISWTVTGKVSDVIRTAGSQKPDLHFDYDAMGQRIAKKVTNKNTTDGTDKFVTTYYVRDPQGNVLAVYEHKHGESDNGTFTLTEQHLYGAGRLGMKKRDLALNVANASEPTPVTHYELTNHLGNVMAVISDKASATNEPTIVSLSDYYPFGMTEPGRSYDAGYRYGFQGQDRERELWGGEASFFTYRISDNRLGRFFSVDPLSSKFPWNSSYAFSENRLIDGVEMEGLEFAPFFTASNSGMNWLRISRIKISRSPLTRPSGRVGWKQWLKHGQETHKWFEEQWEQKGWQTEQHLGRSCRPDGIKINELNRTGAIRELKPNNAAGRAAGRQQLIRYLEAAKKLYPDIKKWSTILELYESAKTFFLGTPEERMLKEYDDNPENFGGMFYEFKEGDTMEDVANSFSVPLDFLYEINGLNKDSKIEPGQEILIDIYVKEPEPEEDPGFIMEYPTEA